MKLDSESEGTLFIKSSIKYAVYLILLSPRYLKEAGGRVGVLRRWLPSNNTCWICVNEGN